MCVCRVLIKVTLRFTIVIMFVEKSVDKSQGLHRKNAIDAFLRVFIYDAFSTLLNNDAATLHGVEGLRAFNCKLPRQTLSEQSNELT